MSATHRRRWVVRPREVDTEFTAPDAAVIVAVTPEGAIAVVTPRGPCRFSRRDVRRLIEVLRLAQAAGIWEFGE